MQDTEQMFIDDLMHSLSYYFVVKQTVPGQGTQLSLSSYAPFGNDRITLSFDSETDTALYLLDEFRKGAIVSEEHVEIARAILRGDQPMFVYEEKQPDGMLLLSLHDELPPKGSHIIVFASRWHKGLARFLLRRLHESKRVSASEETVQQAIALMG